MRLIAALFLLLLGLVLPLLLNGQSFTDSLLALSCAGASGAIALGPAKNRRASEAGRLVGRIVAALAVLLATIVLAQLPSAYRNQDTFNRRMEQLRKSKRQNEAVGLLQRLRAGESPNRRLQRPRPPRSVFGSMEVGDRRPGPLNLDVRRLGAWRLLGIRRLHASAISGDMLAARRLSWHAQRSGDERFQVAGRAEPNLALQRTRPQGTSDNAKRSGVWPVR
jgi:hypothetical protein